MTDLKKTHDKTTEDSATVYRMKAEEYKKLEPSRLEIAAMAMQRLCGDVLYSYNELSGNYYALKIRPIDLAHHALNIADALIELERETRK